MNSSASFTPTELMAAATAALAAAGYQRISGPSPEWDTQGSRLFENQFNVVGVTVFETCRELLRTWPDLQGSLVDVISKHIGQGESKSWDGYLVLLTPSLAPSEEAEIEAVRYNTTRLRKLVATGDDLRGVSDVERVLRALLPLGIDGRRLSAESALDLLPGLLAKRGIREEVTRVVVEAYRNQAPLLEHMHEARGKE